MTRLSLQLDLTDMLDLCSLYEMQFEEPSGAFDRAVYQFLKFQKSPPKEIIEECVWQDPLLSEDLIVENWKSLLSMNLLCALSDVFQNDVAAKIRIFEQHPWNQNSQYLRSMVSLNHALAEMPIPEAGPHLLESGAALIDLQEYHPCLSLPYTPQHVEFGVALCLLALLTNRQDLKEKVLHIAHWQLNTLDALANPLLGLFSREKDGKYLKQLCLSYLFFRGASVLSEQTPFAAVSDSIMKVIHQSIEKEKEKIDSLWILLECWLKKHKIISNAPLNLSEQVYDASTALVGYRTSAMHVICTLHGGHTGLGTLRHGDVEILSYGPQYMPLAECQGFGIEGNALSDQGMRRSIIEWRRNSFCLKGCTRVVDQPTTSRFEMAKFRGIWLEVVQEFKYPSFNLKLTVLGLDGWDDVAFSFFVKAARCKIQTKFILPRTLDRYDGEVQTLLLEGKESTVEIQPLSCHGRLEIIPLAGGNNFWGADFLVAYLLKSDQRHYQWRIGPSRSN